VFTQLVERRSFREPFMRTLTADIVANVIRNVWSYAIIFCGHFPDQTYTFTEDEAKNDVEHHLFPDMPSTQHGEIAPKVHEISIEYGLPYNSGPVHKQLVSVQRKSCGSRSPVEGPAQARRPRRPPGERQGRERRAEDRRRFDSLQPRVSLATQDER
jgi:fatty acid desaturase